MISTVILTDLATAGASYSVFNVYSIILLI